ncbi:hypothetical protein D3C72_1395750 [compost metagenome]
MRSIRVEETAAVGAQVLDALQAGHRPRQQLLARAFERACPGLGVQRLRNALPYIDQRQYKGERQEHAPEHAHIVHPVVADVLAAGACEAPHEAGACSHTRGRPRKHQKGDGRHLRGIGKAALPPVSLPVGVGDERSSGIECQIRRLGRELQRIERQPALQPQHQIAQQHHGRIRQQQGRAITLPANGLAGVHTQRAVTEPLQPGVVVAGKAARQPLAHGNDQHRQNREYCGKFHPG